MHQFTLSFQRLDLINNIICKSWMFVNKNQNQMDYLRILYIEITILGYYFFN